ncbi:hypothetical protein [Streptomyces sp. R44]|uniref:Uncharacterized protein n=1 Tax=Streptomyces sp. R44 TaxID=3238633 RepID=A0AB39SUP1_9ACTN
MATEMIAGRSRLPGAVDSGDMGEGHRAEDLDTAPDDADRVVAVNSILQHWSGLQIDMHGDTRTVERFAREVQIMQTFGRHSDLPRTIAGGVRAEASQQSRALIPPSPHPLPEFRYHRPHEE